MAITLTRITIYGLLVALFLGLGIQARPRAKMATFLTVEREILRPGALVVMAGDPASRLPVAAIRVLQDGIPCVLLTNDGVLGRWSKEHQRNLYQVEWAARRLVELGVPESAIVNLPFSQSGTVHDVRAVQRYVEASGFERLLVVTSDYHTRRTLWTFQHVFKDDFLQVGICCAQSAAPPESDFWQGLAEYRKLIVEFGKYLSYRVRYGFLTQTPARPPISADRARTRNS